MQVEHPLTRQIRLAEVGLEGQARLSRAALCVRGTDGSLIEFVYLHRAGIERLLLGSVTQRVLQDASIPVLVVKGH